MVRSQGSDRSLPAGPSYLIGRDPECDIVITDTRVSWQHAVLRLEDGRWVLADNGSTNGIYAGDRRVDRIEISGECLVRLGHPVDGPVLSCTVRGQAPARPAGPPPAWWSARRPEAPSGPPTMGRSRSARQRPGAEQPRRGHSASAGQPDNDIVIPDPGVSRHHAELRHVAGEHHIVDLDSANGTFVNGQRVSAAPLSEGDIVGIGPATFRLAGQELREFTAPNAADAAARPRGRPGCRHAVATATATARWRSRTRSAGWCRMASGSRTSTS